MARCVESLLKINPALERLRKAGLDLAVATNPYVIAVRAAPRPGVNERPLYARMEGEEWWLPGDIHRGAEIAEELTVQLLEQWDRQ